MIILADDCLIFRTSDGENIPYSAEMISVELMGETAQLFDPEFIKHAAAAVFHFFKNDLKREAVTIAEFSEALEQVLRGFKLDAQTPSLETAIPRVVQSDLTKLVADSDKGCELLFFPRLRDELRTQLQQSPQMLCFQGLRNCVKQLVGAQRWSVRCQQVEDQIVEFLRTCMCKETHGTSCALVVK
ncbi:hypothetical protein [Pedosphaera parvula]|uniref:Uncharacterized protein n=1 Tax=Pedosphaera parvula (strain Ellin514) TaxID=320771 RepID=B9XHZ6_PEDPL|nr:hypothetical protein [Pedosphaera parvula]EEF60489.1 hypothetical protein Cflav_PD3459 [Pedosphaera parvula Ellin514]